MSAIKNYLLTIYNQQNMHIRMSSVESFGYSVQLNINIEPDLQCIDEALISNIWPCIKGNELLKYDNVGFQYLRYKCSCHRGCSDAETCKKLCDVRCGRTKFCQSVLPRIYNINKMVRVSEGYCGLGLKLCNDQEFVKYHNIDCRFRYKGIYILPNQTVDFKKFTEDMSEYYNQSIMKGQIITQHYVYVKHDRKITIMAIKNYCSKTCYNYYDGIIEDICLWKKISCKVKVQFKYINNIDDGCWQIEHELNYSHDIVVKRKAN
jgi:hypothetical protein